MKKGFILGAILTFWVSGCGHQDRADPHPKSTLYPSTQANDTQTKPTRPLRDPIASLSYHFTDQDEPSTFHPTECDTGVRQFKNIHSLCMTLIDHEANANCANHARFTTFANFCAPYGYRPFDGLECKVGLLATEETATALEQDPLVCYEQLKDLKFSAVQNFCVGRAIAESDSIYTPTSETVTLSPTLQVKVQQSYQVPSDLIAQNSVFNASVTLGDERFEKKFTAGREFNFDCEDHRFNRGTERLVVACKPVVGCRNHL